MGLRGRRQKALSMELLSVTMCGVPVESLLSPARAEVSHMVDTLRAGRAGPVELDARGELAAGIAYGCESDSVLPGLCLSDIPCTLLHEVRGYLQDSCSDATCAQVQSMTQVPWMCSAAQMH